MIYKTWVLISNSVFGVYFIPSVVVTDLAYILSEVVEFRLSLLITQYLYLTLLCYVLAPITVLYTIQTFIYLQMMALKACQSILVHVLQFKF